MIHAYFYCTISCQLMKCFITISVTLVVLHIEHVSSLSSNCLFLNANNFYCT